MVIDTETHHADISAKTTENGVEKKEFTISEVLSVITAIHQYEAWFIDEAREQMVKIDMEIEKQNTK